MSELKPCPFCGKKPNPNWTDESYIECTNRKCDIYSFGMSTGAWNTRPIEDALNARIAEAEMASKKAGYEIKRLNKYIDELIKNGNALSFQGMDICGVDSANGTRREKFRVSSWRWEQIVSERDTHGKPVLDE